MSGILFLDRDGVLNEKAPDGEYITSLEHLHLLPGVGEALAGISRTLPDVPVVVVTNQRGVALGMVSRATVDALNERLRALVREFGGDIDAFEVCDHDLGACDCRKPAPGMLRRALARYPDASAADSVMVGDSLSDVQAGAAFGARTALVGDGARRAQVRAAAARHGVSTGHDVLIDAEAASLADLAASGRLTEWLGVPRVVA